MQALVQNLHAHVHQILSKFGVNKKTGNQNPEAYHNQASFIKTMDYNC